MIRADTCKDFPIFSDIKNNEKIAETLKVSYRNNINICQIHDYIKRNFAIKKTKVENFVKISEMHMERSRSNELTHNQKSKLIKKSKECLDMAKKCGSEEDWKNYIEGAIPILIQYSKDCEEVTKLRVETKGIGSDYENAVESRIETIERYFTLVSKFFTTDISRKRQDKYQCPVCSKLFDERLIISEYSYYNCECGHSFYLMSRDIAYHNQVSPVNVSEEVADNFTDTIDRFCGRQSNISIPDELYRQFDDYLRSSGDRTGAEIKKLPKEKSIHKEKIGNLRGTSVSMLISMLKKTNNSLYYDNINLIGHIYFGWTLPDLSEWTGDIMRIYDLTKKVYNRMANKRLSVLNGNVILYFILNYLHIPCSKDNFKLMDTKHSFDNYKENWEVMSKDAEVMEARDEIFKRRGISKKRETVIKL